MKYTPHHTAITVRDLEASIEFYESLGFVRVYQYDDPDESMSIANMKLGESYLEIFWYTKSKDAPRLTQEYAGDLGSIGMKHIALRADDLEGALEDMRAKGNATEETVIIQGGPKVAYFFIQDPDGMWVEFVNDQRYS